ncbi:hypothetical protein HPB48_000867 [Haemaphysalis longicornis]|uniref:Uncharacterized protein n=1 Tax=Haemaphysalis longicornis TaxID=44386 RepID=A0A9J6GQN7_HAELO|nr:hypothetical protein HPB48_000867 [Haemaphysalis longicornis]
MKREERRQLLIKVSSSHPTLKKRPRFTRAVLYKEEKVDLACATATVRHAPRFTRDFIWSITITRLPLVLCRALVAQHPLRILRPPRPCWPRHSHNMSEESVPAHLLKVRWQPKPSWASFGNKAYVAVMGTMFLVGVCGIAFVFRIITQNPDEEVLANGTSSSIVAARYLTQPEKATTEPSPPVAADPHLIHPVHVPLWSAEKLPSIAAKHERGSNESKVASRDRNFSGEDVNDVQGIGAIDDSVSMGTGSVREKSNGSIGLNEHGLVFAGDDEEVYYADVATIINASRNGAEETARKRSEATLRHDSSPASSNSSPTMPLSTSSAAASTTTLPIVSPDSSSSSSAIPRSTSSIAASTTTLPTIATTSSTELSTSTAVATSESTQQVLQAATVGPALAAKGKPFGSSAKGGPVAPWLLLCFYDDRSQTRSPGFSVYDFPAQLCTDVVFCCVDVSTKGRLVVSKHLRLFLRVLGQEFLPQRHLFLALGGHRALIHNLDTVLQNPALLATRLSDEVLTLGAGGLAVHFEDLERLTNGLRVHDLIMALRRVRVAVVLPRDVRQQVRYYRTRSTPTPGACWSSRRRRKGTTRNLGPRSPLAPILGAVSTKAPRSSSSTSSPGRFSRLRRAEWRTTSSTRATTEGAGWWRRLIDS